MNADIVSEVKAITGPKSLYISLSRFKPMIR